MSTHVVEEEPSDLVWCGREEDDTAVCEGMTGREGAMRAAQAIAAHQLDACMKVARDGGAQCKHMCVRGSHRLLLATASSCIDLYLASNVPGPSSGPQPRSSPACAKPVCLKRCDVLRIENAPPSLCFG